MKRDEKVSIRMETVEQLLRLNVGAAMYHRNISFSLFSSQYSRKRLFASGIFELKF